MKLRIDQMKIEDWPDVRRIYEEGIRSGEATFSGRAPDGWEIFLRDKIDACCLVARHEGQVVGWVSLRRYSSQPAYTGVGVLNIYVGDGWQGQGIGSMLMKSLIIVSEYEGIWTLEARIFPENEASVQLHVKHGFRVVGTRERVGWMEHGDRRGTWRDVLLLERRGKLVG